MSGLEPGGSLAKLLSWRVAERPDRGFAFVEDDGPWTYVQLAAASVELGRRLGGLAGGDRVILRLGNDERFLPAAAAVWCRGGTVVAMHPATPVEDVARIGAAMDTRMMICDPDDPVVGAVDLPTLTFPRFSPEDGAETRELAAAFASPTGNDALAPALILLTSGSTGEPKGVVLTHDSAWTMLRATVSSFRRDPGPSPLAAEGKAPNLIASPLSHTGGVIRLLVALYVGRSVVLLKKFDGRSAKRLIDRHQIDSLTINPTMMRMLIDALEPDEALGSVLYVSSGTAPLTPALREEFEARFNVPVLQAYGQTETFGAVAIESARDVLAGRRRPASVGRPLPGVTLRLVKADGSEAATGQEGEIRVRTRTAMAGYLGSGDASALDDEGWLRTGDLGKLDKDGYLYVTGRLKNIVICGGFNVVPEEVEAALDADPDVRESVVVGVPDDRLGEIPVALVESNLAAAAVLDNVRVRLAAYKRPRRVFVVDALPRVLNGKVDRPQCQKIAQSLVVEV